jgi:8-oxo-dGTP diphosphatase
MKISEIFVTVDIVLIRKLIDDYELLLIKRRNEPFKDNWALPGGFVDKNEDLETAAIRELVEETSITVSELEQLKAFGKPFRDPRNHVVSVAFLE